MLNKVLFPLLLAGCPHSAEELAAAPVGEQPRLPGLELAMVRGQLAAQIRSLDALSFNSAFVISGGEGPASLDTVGMGSPTSDSHLEAAQDLLGTLTEGALALNKVASSGWRDLAQEFPNRALPFVILDGSNPVNRYRTAFTVIDGLSQNEAGFTRCEYNRVEWPIAGNAQPQMTYVSCSWPVAIGESTARPLLDWALFIEAPANGQTFKLGSKPEHAATVQVASASQERWIFVAGFAAPSADRQRLESLTLGVQHDSQFTTVYGQADFSDAGSVYGADSFPSGSLDVSRLHSLGGHMERERPTFFQATPYVGPVDRVRAAEGGVWLVRIQSEGFSSEE